jgi:hypothetical protein
MSAVKAVAGLEDMIQGKVQKLVKRLNMACDQGTVVQLDAAYCAGHDQQSRTWKSVDLLAVQVLDLCHASW